MGTGVKGDEWQQKYGADFLALLEEQRDWRSVQALWRWGSTTGLPALAEVMARSGDPVLALLLGIEVDHDRYAAYLPDLPDLLHLHSPPVSAEVAAAVLARLLDPERPLAAQYQDKHHLLVSWLMRQPGEVLDDLAIEIALGGHVYSGLSEPNDAAVGRIGHDADLGARLVQAFLDHPDRWDTGSGWTRTARVVGQIGNTKGRAVLVKALTVQLLLLPPDEDVRVTPEFGTLIERHGAKELASAFAGSPLPDSPGPAAAMQALAGFTTTLRDDLVETLAANQPVLWSAHRQTIHNAWDDAAWERMLTRWSQPFSALVEFGEVIDEAPATTNMLRMRVALLHGTEPGDYAARVFRGILKTVVGSPEEEADIASVVGAVPWDLVTTDERVEYLRWVFDEVLAEPDACKVLIGAYLAGLLTAEHAVSLTPEAECVAAFTHIPPGAQRAAYAAALHECCGKEFTNPILAEVIASSDDTFDVVEVTAVLDTGIAFGSFDEDRWHGLSPTSRDRLITLLEEHATIDQVDLLDLIAADSEASNAGRRSRAAHRWAALAPLHGDIPPGVFSLLDSARPDLNQAFAKVAATVQPRDESTLLRLRAKWVQGGKPGDDARAALDAVAEGAVATLTPLTGPARRTEGPALLRILGVTAATGSFESLINHVGADAIDDDLELRRSAASALRTYVDSTRLDPEQLAALGAGAAAEPDAEASEHLLEALAAARMGEDAAILLLYDIAGLASSEVTGTPTDLFGSEKPRLLTALQQLVVQRELGEPGWAGYVEQMDLVGEALVRAAYLRFGDSEPLKNDIRKNSKAPDYGVLLRSLGKAKGFDAPSVHLLSLHDVRSNRTAAHHPNGGPLDEDAVRGAVNNLETGAREIIIRLQNNGPLLRAVEPDAS